jgi:hypothetical protein
MLSELTLTLLFWLYLWFCATDYNSMSRQQIKEKLYYDVFEDVDNYNHSLPLVLLMVEFLVNNI